MPDAQATQLELSANGSNPASHWQFKAVGSAVVDTFTAFAAHEHVLEPETLALLR
jgi:hypothetical protein